MTDSEFYYPCPLCGAMFLLNEDGCKSTCRRCGMTYCGDPDEVDGLIPVLTEADWEALRRSQGLICDATHGRYYLVNPDGSLGRSC